MVKQFLLTNIYHLIDDKLNCLAHFQTPTHDPRQMFFIFCLSEYILTPRFNLLVLRQCFSVLQCIVHFQSPTHGPQCLRARWHVTGIRIPGFVFTSEGNLRWGLTDTCASWDANLAMLFSTDAQVMNNCYCHWYWFLKYVYCKTAMHVVFEVWVTTTWQYNRRFSWWKFILIIKYMSNGKGSADTMDSMTLLKSIDAASLTDPGN